MKYRIKTIEKNNGEKMFVAQGVSAARDIDIETKLKILVLLFIPIINLFVLCIIVIKFTAYDDIHSYKTLGEAKDHIDHLIIKQKLADALEHEQKIKSVTYQKYP